LTDEFRTLMDGLRWEAKAFEGPLTEPWHSTGTKELRYNAPMNPRLEDVTLETAEMLHAQATAQGLSVEAYLRALLGLGSATNALADLSDEAFDALMEDFAKGTTHVPPLPPDFSRDDIYADHD
jgi:hypothetical protein